jgi:hypothetical protein
MDVTLLNRSVTFPDAGFQNVVSRFGNPTVEQKCHILEILHQNVVSYSGNPTAEQGCSEIGKKFSDFFPEIVHYFFKKKLDTTTVVWYNFSRAVARVKICQEKFL